eukprot:365675-Chlamydomonas_euryale.AAC.2
MYSPQPLFRCQAAAWAAGAPATTLAAPAHAAGWPVASLPLWSVATVTCPLGPTWSSVCLVRMPPSMCLASTTATQTRMLVSA